MPEIGYAAIVLAGLLTAYAIAAALLGRQQPPYLASARWSAVAIFLLLTVAVAMLEVALVTHDFSVLYVAENNASTTPLLFSIAGLWGGLGGSILFWAWLLAGLIAAIGRGYRGRADLLPLVLAIQFGVLAFFLLVMIGPANPFERLLPAPAEGAGLNPLLQNHPLMLVHPPMLYVGFVGLTAPYAFAMAALIAQRAQDEWLILTRRWTLAAWTALFAGIVVGAWWSYEVLGWGGFWGWDPVENASLMPWLTATALVHSAMVQEHRRMLRGWNLTLVIVTFLLTIVGTFLTRSGILSSVHAFAQSPVGMMFLAFIALALFFSLYLLLRKQPPGEEAALDSYASRESAFLVSNFLFVAFAFVVFVGTIFPLLSEAIGGEKISVGPPFFAQVNVPIALGLLVLMGLGPMLPWRRARGPQLVRDVIAPATASLVAALVAAALSLGGAGVVAAIAVLAFVVAATLQEFYLGARARQRGTGERFPVALFGVFARNRRRYGGYVAHLGIVIVAVGLLGSTAFMVEAERSVQPGQTIRLGRYTLRFEAMEERQAPDRRIVAARFTVLNGGRPIAVMRPSSNYYPGRDTPIATPNVRSTVFEDLYLVLIKVDQGSATLRAMVHPLASWVWTGGGVLVLGAVIAMWPRRRLAVS